jgi:4-methyl-5(b-hydroxyethyl)-thiazole monophosphate biosynthesis
VAQAYIFLADGFEEIEGLTVVDLFRRVDIAISMVSINKTNMVTGAHQIEIKADRIFEEVDYNDGDILILPGGMPGTNHLMEHEGLDRLLKDFNSKGKLLAAICAAPSVLGQKNILSGKKATCYPGFEEKLIGAQVVKDGVVEDGNVITSKGMGTAIDFSLALIKRLKGEDVAKKLAASIQYNYY